MKSRIKATEEIVDIIRNSAFDKDVFYDSNGQKYNREELSFDVKEKSFPKDTPDYWTRLEHTYAGMAMQQLVHLVNVGYEYVYEETAIIAMNFVHALVEKLKEKEERK